SPRGPQNSLQPVTEFQLRALTFSILFCSHRPPSNATASPEEGNTTTATAMALNRGVRSGLRLLASCAEASAPASRGFHSTGVRRMGAHTHDEPYYVHAKHMYNLHRMKHQQLTACLSVLAVVSIGVGVPVYAVVFQQKKTASGQLRGNRQFKSESIHVLPIHRKRRRDRIKQSPMAVVQPLRRGLLPLLFVLLVVLRPQSCAASGVGEPAEFEIPRDGTVVELDESNFDAALRSADYLFVDFYAPWCGHCKRLAPQLDEAAPVLAGLATPIVIAKVNADKYKNLRSKYEIDGFPTLMFFDHGVPSEYTGSRKADLLIENLKKLVAPAVSVLKSDAAIKGFVEAAGVGFPLFIGFGVEESLIAEYGAKYKKKAWFSVAKDFSEDMMVLYDFDKAPALISHNPKYNEQSVFYGPFEGTFLEDFIRQSLLPLTVPINRETVKLLDDDDRKVVLTILDDETDENSPQLIKVLRSAASANHDLIFGYVGVKQWEEFTETFDVSKSSRQPKMIVWDRDEEYEVVEGSEQLEEGDYGSQISQFLEGYRAGRTIKKKVGRGFPTLLGVNALYILILLVAVLLVMMYFAGQGEENIRPRAHAD
ncbi:hypothetical protein EJB05_21371, partial [Eragrostis curvula]